MTQLNFGRDIQGYNAYAPAPSDLLYSATITASGNSSITVPGNSQNWIVSFSFEPPSIFWVAYNASAAIPGGPTFDTTTSELNPSARLVQAGTVINILNGSAAAANVGIELYAIP